MPGGRGRQVGSHERCRHADGRAVTIPRHGGGGIGPPLFHRILRQMGIDQKQFDDLK
jgi:predicted RNA binding protein YcfA (HicA-like mRNA interferase family)